jgi:hypothetical protein
MSKIKNNPLLKGVSGMMGDTMVYRDVRGKVIMANRPRKSKKVPSASQQEQRDRFLDAAEYAKAVEAHPASAAEYQDYVGDAYSSIYAAATADYLRFPRIRSVDTTAYNGAVGETIEVKAIKAVFKGVSVHVTIRSSNGTVIEAGSAVQLPGMTIWTYTATVANASRTGTKITIRVKDRPGNVITQELTL